MRRKAKAVNFGIVYGMSDWGLAEALHIPQWEAADFIEKYFMIYPEIKEYLDKTVKEAKNNGYTQTIFKRRRYIPELNSSNHNLQKFGERTAMNAPIQGSAADVIKIAMIDVYNKIEELSLKSKMVAQVHDELIIDTTPDELEIVKKMIKETMEKAVSLNVLLEADVEVGKTWDLK
jgi:DNA polymerase-1